MENIVGRDPNQTKKRVAILGYAPSVRFAPWDDPTIELWGLNDQPYTMPRIDVLFELHTPEVIKIEGHWDKLKTLDRPIFMQDHYPEIPTSIRYPLKEMWAQWQEMTSGTLKPYLTCSASEMLAIAVNTEPAFEEIHLYGIDMQMDTEFGKQRPSCEFWLGVAAGKGIKLVMQPVSDLLQCRFIYGYEDELLLERRAAALERKKWLTDQHQAAVAKEVAAKEERLQYVGALADCDHVIQRWNW